MTNDSRLSELPKEQIRSYNVGAKNNYGVSSGKKGELFMMNVLQTGKALYVLAAICLAGILVRMLAGSFYKGLIKESANLALTKNKYLRALKQNAEDTYRMNQGMNNTRVYLEKQLYSLKMLGLSVKGVESLSGQLTLLCFLVGGAAAFGAYWYRSDNYYIVLYGAVGILSGMLTMLVDYGVNLESRRQQLLTCLQDYLENVMWPRMARENAEIGMTAGETADKPGNLVRAIGRERRGQARRGMEQTAASREKLKEQAKAGEAESIGENWLKELNPEQKRVLGELLKEFIS